MSSLQEHLILRESSSSHRSVTPPSIGNLLNPEILPLKSPEIIQGGYIPTGDIPEFEMGGLGPPAVKFTELKKVLNHFPSHSGDLKLLALPKPAFSPTPGSMLFPLESPSIPKSSPVSVFQSQQLSAADSIPIPIPIPVPRPVAAMSFLSKFNSTGFGSVVTDGPSPYWKYSPSGPYYPPPGPFKSGLSSVLTVAPTALYSPSITEWQAYDQFYFSAKMQRKRQRSASPDACPSRKYQRAGEGSRHELASICSHFTAPLCRLLNRCDPNEYLCAGEGDRQELPACFRCESPLRELATQYAPDDSNRTGKEALYDPSSVDHQGETSCWVDNGSLEYQMLRQRSRDSGCDTDGPSNSPMTASPHDIKRSSIVLRSYKASLSPFEGLNPITSNVLTSDNTPP